MKYQLVYHLRGADVCFDLSRDDYGKVKEARQFIFTVLEIEDKFDMMLSNYEELERSILELALQNMIYADFSWTEYRSDTELVNRRLVNLLSTARLYIDQLSHQLAHLEVQCPGIKTACETEKSAQYDHKLGYRAMEAVRNYVQHRGLPIRGMDYTFKQTIERPPHHRQQYSSSPYLDTRRLKDDGNFKASVLAELDAHGPKHPVAPLFREYIEGLALVHNKVRELTSARIEQSEKILDNAMDSFRNRTKIDPKWLEMISTNEKGKQIEQVAIFIDPRERLGWLRKKNGHLTNLARRYVTGKIDAEDSNL